MYLPPHFKEDQLPVMHEAMRQIGLATLVSPGADGLIASHLPLLLDPEPAPYGMLRGHVARANPHWRIPDVGAQSLAVFLGPAAYISPAWYPTKKETGKVVPTWNYVAIHAYGRATFFEDPERLLAIVTRLTETHEGKRTAPWAVSDAPADYIQRQLKAIVGFELPIERLEGKWKMSQNQPAENKEGAIKGLIEEGGGAEGVVARIMEVK